MPNNTLILTAVATVLGFLSGIGVGGGSLLLLWLTLVVGTDPASARLTNLLFYLPSAAVSCYLNWRKGKLSGKTVVPLAVTGCAGALAGSMVEKSISIHTLKKLFGILLMITGTRELLYNPKKQVS